MKLKRKHLFPIIWLGLIVYASLTPAKNIPSIKLFPHFDKVVHFGIYFVLSVLLLPAVLIKRNYTTASIFSFILSITIGLLFELLQTYVTVSRSGSMWDEVANISGAFMGVLFYLMVIKNKKLESIFFKSE